MTTLQVVGVDHGKRNAMNGTTLAFEVGKSDKKRVLALSKVLAAVIFEVRVPLLGIDKFPDSAE